MDIHELTNAAEQLGSAAAALQGIAEDLAAGQNAFAESAAASIGRIVATVETRHNSSIEERLAVVEGVMAELQARREPAGAGRKTLSSVSGASIAKQPASVGAFDASALDGALVSLSLEQRIAVKAQLIRAGILG